MGEGQAISPVAGRSLRAANRAYADQRWADCERLVQEVLAAQPESVQGWRLAGVHLAASLARPTWMPSRVDACWRWMAPREDSPRYPGLKIFNQQTPDEWSPVARALGVHLSATA